MKLSDLSNLDKDDILSAPGLVDERTASARLLGSLGILAVGVLVGAGAALLLAPTSGRALRAELAQRFARSAKARRRAAMWPSPRFHKVRRAPDRVDSTRSRPEPSALAGGGRRAADRARHDRCRASAGRAPAGAGSRAGGAEIAGGFRRTFAAVSNGPRPSDG